MLNYKFLDKLNKEHLVMQTSDMIADNGDKSYGTCKDYVTILSCDQYRKYRALVPCYPERICDLLWSEIKGGAINDRRNCITPVLLGEC